MISEEDSPGIPEGKNRIYDYSDSEKDEYRSEVRFPDAGEEENEGDDISSAVGDYRLVCLVLRFAESVEDAVGNGIQSHQNIRHNQDSHCFH